MKKLTTLLFLIVFWIPHSALAGVVMTMVTSDGSGRQIDSSKIFAQSEMIRVDNIGGENMSMIFRGEEMLMLSHTDKTYFVMDQAMLEQLSSQMNEATKMMEAQLAQVPPEQRAMVEKMMQGQMQNMMSMEPPPPPRVETGGASSWLDYSCTQYTVYSGSDKSQEICAASPNQIEGSDEVIGAFQNMAAFMTKMSESMPGPMASGMARNPTGMMDQIDGFPVHTLHYENGRVIRETSLESITQQSLDESIFSAPADYAQQQMFGH